MNHMAKATGIGVTVGILGLIAGLTPMGHQVEEMLGLHLLFSARGPRAAPLDVAIITIDKASADKLGLDPEPDRWPRSIHARLVDRLVHMGAEVIAFDMLFEENRSRDEDVLLGKAMERAGNVILVQSLRVERVPLANQEPGQVNIESLILPTDPLAKSAAAMAPFPLPKIPVKISQYWTFKTSAGDLPTFPVVAFQMFTSAIYEEFVSLLLEAGVRFPPDFPITKEDLDTVGGVEKSMRELRLLGRQSPNAFREALEQLDQIEVVAEKPVKVNYIRELLHPN